MKEERTVPHRVDGAPVKTLRVDVVEGPDAATSVSAKSDAISIGTAEANDLVLADETVSRYHLELVRAGDRVLIRDHGSTNGTFVHDVRIERGAVSPGAQIKLGRTTVCVTDGETIKEELHAGSEFEGLIGQSALMRKLMARLARVAQSDASVLLLGETGTGKEVIAQAIHRGSPRAREPFVTVDCGALMPTLVASELFGHEKGAFTGADRRHAGAFERAHGGTLFLDEIGELPAQLQATLLGALERRRFRRLGGTEEISVDVRVVSATHRDLRKEVNAGTFRQDLYFRLAVLLLPVPPLRDRPDDLPVLIQHFLHQIGSEEDVRDAFPRSVMETLEAHHWPGNVRELKNLVEATVAMGEPPELHADAESDPADGEEFQFPSFVLKKSYKDARAQALDAFECEFAKKLLARTKGNAARAARDAKMDRSYLFKLIKKHDLRS